MSLRRHFYHAMHIIPTPSALRHQWDNVTPDHITVHPFPSEIALRGSQVGQTVQVDGLIEGEYDAMALFYIESVTLTVHTRMLRRAADLLTRSGVTVMYVIPKWALEPYNTEILYTISCMDGWAFSQRARRDLGRSASLQAIGSVPFHRPDQPVLHIDVNTEKLPAHYQTPPLSLRRYSEECRSVWEHHIDPYA
jgi:hypothetical protein